jgi:hypothetical protein
MLHMSPHQMPRRQRRIQTQFTRKHRSSNDTRELARIIAGRTGVGAANAEEVEHGGLRFEDRAAADCSDFDGGHGDGDLEVAM